MYDSLKAATEIAQTIVVIQAENPDGDSLGSALALEEILGDQGKYVSLYCPVDIPKYLRYLSGWDRVTHEFPSQADLAIIVDTSADVLLGKVLEVPHVRHFLETHPVMVLDHHTTDSTLSFEHTLISETVVATGELLYKVAHELHWPINAQAAEHILAAIMSDSLGLTTQTTTADTVRTVASLIDLGASNAALEEHRREYMKKSPEILAYKGELISRVEYFLDGRLAIVHIPWEDIQKYSDQYNPGALILDEIRLVEGVDIGIAIKTYPDGKLTARIRASKPIAETIAGYFGGGGHPHAAGFRVYDTYETILPELLTATEKTLREVDA